MVIRGILYDNSNVKRCSINLYGIIHCMMFTPLVRVCLLPVGKRDYEFLSDSISDSVGLDHLTGSLHWQEYCIACPVHPLMAFIVPKRAKYINGKMHGGVQQVKRFFQRDPLAQPGAPIYERSRRIKAMRGYERIQKF